MQAKNKKKLQFRTNTWQKSKGKECRNNNKINL